MRRPTASRHASRLLAAAALACVLPLACSGEASPPHVLLLTVDTLRPDYLSLNGYDRATTPTLDALLGRGFYFEQALAPVPRTTPALASLLTGGYPHTTGVRTLTDPLSEDVSTLAELLRAEGYQTVAVVTNQVLSRRRGLDRGFAVYEMAADSRTARGTTDAALAQLAEIDPGTPLFAWIHYIDPHVPYDTDPVIAKQFDPDYQGPYQLAFGSNGAADTGRGHRTFPEDLPKGEATHRNPLPARVNDHIRRLYAADIRFLDDQIDRMLAGWRERFGDGALVVFTADHGESLGEHDFYFDHGDYVYNAGTRVPLGFVLPPRHRWHGQGRCAGWVSLVDVVPTLAELLDLDLARISGQLEGRSLTACMRGETLATAPVFAESGHSYYFDHVRRRQRNDVAGRFRAVVRDRWKLIWTPFLPDAQAWELYDVEADPHERRNLYRPDHPAVAELAPLLARHVERSGEAPAERALSEEDERALRALGYLGE